MNDIIISLGGRAPPSQNMPTPCEGSRWLPGSRKIDNLEDNIAAVGIMLTPKDRTRIADAMTGVQGARYAEREIAMLRYDRVDAAASCGLPFPERGSHRVPGKIGQFCFLDLNQDARDRRLSVEPAVGETSVNGGIVPSHTTWIDQRRSNSDRNHLKNGSIRRNSFLTTFSVYSSAHAAGTPLYDCADSTRCIISRDLLVNDMYRRRASAASGVEQINPSVVSVTRYRKAVVGGTAAAKQADVALMGRPLCSFTNRSSRISHDGSPK